MQYESTLCFGHMTFSFGNLLTGYMLATIKLTYIWDVSGSLLLTQPDAIGSRLVPGV